MYTDIVTLVILFNKKHNHLQHARLEMLGLQAKRLLIKQLCLLRMQQDGLQHSGRSTLCPNPVSIKSTSMYAHHSVETVIRLTS